MIGDLQPQITGHAKQRSTAQNCLVDRSMYCPWKEDYGPTVPCHNIQYHTLHPVSQNSLEKYVTF